MKAWKIPEDHKKLLAELREENQALADAWDRGWALIEELTGVKPGQRPPSAEFAFVPKDKEAALPEGLRWRKPRSRRDRAQVVPDRRTKEGRKWVKAWKEAGIARRGLKTLDWYIGLFGVQTAICREGAFAYKTEVINGVEYVIDGGAIPLAEFGYEEVEVELSVGKKAQASC